MPHTNDAIALVSSGIPGLDEILGGGLPRGHLYLVEGMTGTGKTTFAIQFALAGARAGERVLYITLAETERDLHKMAASHGWSLDGLKVLELYLPQEQRNPQQEYNLFYPAEIELGERTERIQEAVERVNPQRLVLDSLSSLRLLATETPNPVDLTILADTVIVLRFLNTGTGLHPVLCAVKHRAGPIDRIPHELRIMPSGLSVGPARPDIQGLFPGLASLRDSRIEDPAAAAEHE